MPNSSSILTVGRFGYTGQAWLPDLGMWYYKARIYSPMLGRFLQIDPIGYKDQVNLYAYVGNDPVDRRDPTGRYKCADRKACDIYENGKMGLLKSIQKLEKSRSERDRSIAALERRALRDMGTRDDNNGVTISSNREIDAARWNSDTNSMEINTSTIGRGSEAMLAGVVGHELTHEIQDRAGLLTLKTMRYSEYQAYVNGAVIRHSLGDNGLWSKANDDVDRSRINSMARLSCLSDVGQDHWSVCR